MIRNFFLIFSYAIIIFSHMNCNKNHLKKTSNKTLRLNYYSTSNSFHPHQSKDALNVTLCKALYEGLTRVNLKGKVELALAEKMEISPCKKRYTFTLKNTKWSNKQEVTSYHFVEAWKKALNPQKGICPQSKRFFLIKNAKDVFRSAKPICDLGVYAPDDRTIIIELEHPAPYFPQLLADPAYSPLFNPASEEEPTVSNGPFIIKKYELEKKLTLEANPFYWDAKTIKLNEIQISFVKDENTAFTMYEEGYFDWVGAPFSEIPFEALKANSNIKSQHTSSPFWIFFNTENYKLSSANIRKALSYSVNRLEIVKKIAPYQRELYTVIPSDLSLVDSSKYIENCTIENAKILFEKGLKELGLKKDEFSFVLNHSNCSDHERIAVYLKHLWEKTFNIKITLIKDEWNTFCSKMRSDDYEIGGCYVCNIYEDPSCLLESFEKGNSFFSRWSNKSYQELIQQSKHAINEDDRLRFLEEAEKILMEEMPVCPLYNQNNLFLCRKKLKNLYPPKFNYMDFKWAYFNNNP